MIYVGTKIIQPIINVNNLIKSGNNICIMLSYTFKKI